MPVFLRVNDFRPTIEIYSLRENVERKILFLRIMIRYIAFNAIICEAN